MNRKSSPTIAEANEPVAANLLRIIKNSGMKKKRIAEKAGFSKTQFSDMLNGRKIIKPCDVIAISESLEVPVGDLYRKDRDFAENEGS